MKNIYFVSTICIVIVIMACKNRENPVQNSSNSEIVPDTINNELLQHLENAMRDLDNSLGISDNLTEDVYLKSFGFFKNGDDNYYLILKLNDDISSKTVNKYTFGLELHVFEKDKAFLLPYSKSKGRLYDLRPFRPELIAVKGHKYVISEMTFEMKEFEKLVFYLYPRSGYKGKILGKKVQLLDYSI